MAQERIFRLQPRVFGTSEGRRRHLGIVLSTLVLVAAGQPVMAGEHGKAENPEGAAAGGPAYVKLPPIVLPVFDGNRVTRQAGLAVTLELVKGKTGADVEPKKRQLTDAFITGLYGVYEMRGSADRVIDPAVVKETLQGASDRVLGKGVIQQVLIQQAFEGSRAR
jgi:hypothetical protein